MAAKKKREQPGDAGGGFVGGKSYATIEEAVAAAEAEPHFETLADYRAWRENIRGSRPEDVE